MATDTDPAPAEQALAKHAWLPVLLGIMVYAKTTTSWPDLIGQVALVGCAGLLAFQVRYILVHHDAARDHGILFTRGAMTSDSGLALLALVDVGFALAFSFIAITL